MIPVPKDAIDEIGRLAAEVSRLHEIVCEQDDMIAELTEQVDYLVGGNEELMGFLNACRDRVVDLEEALEKARALRGDAPKKGAGDPGAR